MFLRCAFIRYICRPNKALPGARFATIDLPGVRLNKATVTRAATSQAKPFAIRIGMEYCQVRRADVLDANSVDSHAKAPRALHLRYDYTLALIQSAAEARNQAVDTNFVAWIEGSPLPRFYLMLVNSRSSAWDTFPQRITEARICAPHRLGPLRLRYN